MKNKKRLALFLLLCIGGINLFAQNENTITISGQVWNVVYRSYSDVGKKRTTQKPLNENFKCYYFSDIFG